MSPIKYVIVVCFIVWFTSAKSFNEWNKYYYQKIKNEPIVVQWMDFANAKCNNGRQKAVFAQAAVNVAENIAKECEAIFPTNQTYPTTDAWIPSACMLLDRNLGCANKCFMDKLTEETGLPFNELMQENKEALVLFDAVKMTPGAVKISAERWLDANHDTYNEAKLTQHGTCEFWGCQAYHLSYTMNTYGRCIRRLLAKDVDLFP